MFAAIWKHPAAKYVGAIGLVVPLVVMIYYTYIESWTAAFAWFSLTKDYWGITTQDGMVAYLQGKKSYYDNLQALHVARATLLYATGETGVAP